MQRGKAHMQKSTGRANFDPNDIKILEFFFKFELDVHDYVSRGLHQCKFSFHSIQRGFSPEYMKYYGFLTFFLISYLVIVYSFFGLGPGQVEPVIAHKNSGRE